jgi:hypothetical protein
MSLKIFINFFKFKMRLQIQSHRQIFQWNSSEFYSKWRLSLNTNKQKCLIKAFSFCFLIARSLFSTIKSMTRFSCCRDLAKSFQLIKIVFSCQTFYRSIESLILFRHMKKWWLILWNSRKHTQNFSFFHISHFVQKKILFRISRQKITDQHYVWH